MSRPAMVQHWTPSDWSYVRCLRPNCCGGWRTKSNYVYSLPNCTNDWEKAERLRASVAAAYARKRETEKYVGQVAGAVSEALGELTAGAATLATQFSAPFSSARVALLQASRDQEVQP